MIYRFLRILLRIGMFFYYRRLTFIGRENLQFKSPKVLIANHPNTIMDAWIVGAASKEPVYFMAKGTFFNTPLKRSFLRALGLIPINRASDEKTSGVSNEDSFEQCYRLLEEGKNLVIFPEGSSYAERVLRKLKSGTARIVLQTEERNNCELGIKVIPIGINYQQADKFRSAVKVRIGKPIDPRPFVEEFKEDRLKAARKLTDFFRQSLMEVLVAAETKSAEGLSDRVASLLDPAYDRGSRFDNRIELLKRVNERIHEVEQVNPTLFQEIENLTNEITLELNEYGIKSSFLNRRFRSTMFIRQLLTSVLALTLALPIYLYGVFHHYLTFKLNEFLMKRMVAEVEYYAPIAILVGLVLYPLTYWGWTELFIYLTDFEPFWTWIYFLSLPVTGLLTYSFLMYYQHVNFKWKYILTMIDKRDEMNALLAKRDKLKELIFPN